MMAGLDDFLDSLNIAFNRSLLYDMFYNETFENSTDTPSVEDEIQFEKDLFNYYLMGVGGTSVCFIGILCNFLSVVVLTRSVMNSSTYSYLTSLAICDTLALACTVMIFLLGKDTQYPEKGMLTWGRDSYAYLFPYLHPLAVMFQVTSIWLTLAFTVDRYIMICHPFKAESMCSVSRARKVIIGIFILGALYNIPKFLEYTHHKVPMPSLSGGVKERVMIVCVGITCARYVSLANARPWLVHSYRNIRGRGLHVEEESSQTLPLEQTTEVQTEIPTEEDKPMGIDSTLSTKQSMVSISGRELSNQNITRDSAEDSLKTIGKSPTQTNTETVEKQVETTEADKQRETDKQMETDKQAELKEILEADKQESSDIQGASAAKKPRIDIETKQGIGNTTATLDKDLESLSSQNSSNKDEETSNVTLITDSKGAESISKDPDIFKDEGKYKERFRKRKLPEESESPQDDAPKAVSTYDRVRLIIQPWRKPEGGINKPIFKMMLESVMLFFMMHPGSTENNLVYRYKPYLQPMVLKSIIQILMDLGCLNVQYLKKPKVSLFSTYCPEETCLFLTDTPDDDNIEAFFVPTEEGLFRLGQFGRELYPHAKWPESTQQN